MQAYKLSLFMLYLPPSDAKAAQVLFTVELESRLARSGAHAYCLHPGAGTNLCSPS